MVKVNAPTPLFTFTPKVKDNNVENNETNLR
jgi:hypothetical protein